MVKRKLTGQTIAIIILSIFLVLAIVFGGVYAVYTTSTSKISGKIVMAVLDIEIDKSSSTQMVISNGYCVPGETLKNTELALINSSNTSTYLVVVYSLKANEQIVGYDDTKPLIDIGLKPNDDWTDYLFVNEESQVRRRCLICTAPQKGVETASKANKIVVIKENTLRIPVTWGNGYQEKEIVFSFQAFTVAEKSFSFGLDTTREEKCSQIMNAIYTENSSELIWK